MGVFVLTFSNIGCTPSFRSPPVTTGTTGAALVSEPTAPNAPLNVVALVGNQQASVSFTEPASDGGSAITGYTVTSSPGGFTGFGSSSPIVVSGLTNGTAYTFTVTATNANGTSIPSTASTAIIPATVPGARPTGGDGAARGDADGPGRSWIWRRLLSRSFFQAPAFLPFISLFCFCSPFCQKRAKKTLLFFTFQPSHFFAPFQMVHFPQNQTPKLESGIFSSRRRSLPFPCMMRRLKDFRFLLL